MPLSTAIHAAPIRVRYAETDAMGVAHHGSYVAWFEVGRVEWLRAAGQSYVAFERDGYALPVVELAVRYVSPARFDDALLVRTGLVDLRSRTVRFVYEIVTDTPRPRQIANGSTRHVCLRHGQVARLPELLRRIVEKAAGDDD